jgi:15-cis-phytoene synthase
MSEHLQQAYEICGRLVKLHDPDRHMASLFAPEDRRPYLHALQAFSLEIAGIRGAAKDALPGEIRLQWWREALGGERGEEAQAHPVALAILDTVQTNRLPMKAFQDLIEARVCDLYDDPMPDWHTLEGYCGETSSSLFKMACIILSKGDDPGGHDAAGHAGVAYALAGLLRAFPWHARRGQIFLPQSLMNSVGLTREDVIAGKDSENLRAALAAMRAKVREHLEKAIIFKKDVPAQIKPAFLPLSSVPGYLANMEKAKYFPYSSIVDILQWQRIWRMWRASRHITKP